MLGAKVTSWLRRVVLILQRGKNINWLQWMIYIVVSTELAEMRNQYHMLVICDTLSRRPPTHSGQWRRQLWGTGARAPLNFQQFYF